MASPSNKFVILSGAILLQLCIGSIYAWSYFQPQLVDRFGWSQASVAGVFGLAILMLSISAAVIGRRLSRLTTAKVAIVGALMFALGLIGAGVALWATSLLGLYIGFALIGGLGIGMAYITPVYVVSAYFPENRGLATGAVVMGFGLGAMVTSKLLAPWLMAWLGSLHLVFIGLGICFGLLGALGASVLRQPSTPSSASEPFESEQQPKVSALLPVWLMMFCNTFAGVIFISFQSPLLQDLLTVAQPGLSAAELTKYGATLIAVSALFNGLGRFFWGGLSDRIGQLQAFRIMLMTQILAFASLLVIASPLLFAAVVCYILLCYGGGFGTLPSLVASLFGPANMSQIYGKLLSAWGIAGIAGALTLALLKDKIPESASTLAFVIAAAILTLGLVSNLVLSRRDAR